jgi:transposase InsO family protein
MSRQNYYKQTQRKAKQEFEEELMLHLVKTERKIQPCIGGRKLHYMVKTECLENGIKIGRDKFFAFLSRNDLLISREARIPRTTDSRHRLGVYENILKDSKITKQNEAWVSDITYIRTMEGFMYAALITDYDSRKIIGTHIGDSLESIGCINALKMALNTLKKGEVPIHHSDRGCQYCSYAYIDMLTAHNIRISMTEKNHCYENAMAERVNGILKQEFELGQTFKTKEQAKKAFEQAVYIYNNRRPHIKLGYRTPHEVYNKAA